MADYSCGIQQALQTSWNNNFYALLYARELVGPGGVGEVIVEVTGKTEVRG